MLFFKSVKKLRFQHHLKQLRFLLLSSNRSVHVHVLSRFGHSLIFHLLRPHGVLCFNITKRHSSYPSLSLTEPLSIYSALVGVSHSSVFCFCLSLFRTHDRCCRLAQTSWGKNKCQFRSETGFHLHWSFDYQTPDTSTWNNTWNLIWKQSHTDERRNRNRN